MWEYTGGFTLSVVDGWGGGYDKEVAPPKPGRSAVASEETFRHQLSRVASLISWWRDDD